MIFGLIGRPSGAGESGGALVVMMFEAGHSAKWGHSNERRFGWAFPIRWDKYYFAYSRRGEAGEYGARLGKIGLLWGSDRVNGGRVGEVAAILGDSYVSSGKGFCGE